VLFLNQRQNNFGSNYFCQNEENGAVAASMLPGKNVFLELLLAGARVGSGRNLFRGCRTVGLLLLSGTVTHLARVA